MRNLAENALIKFNDLPLPWMQFYEQDLTLITKPRLVLEGSQCLKESFSLRILWVFVRQPGTCVAPQCIGFGFNDAYKAGKIGFVLSTFRFVIWGRMHCNKIARPSARAATAARARVSDLLCLQWQPMPDNVEHVRSNHEEAAKSLQKLSRRPAARIRERSELFNREAFFSRLFANKTEKGWARLETWD